MTQDPNNSDHAQTELIQLVMRQTAATEKLLKVVEEMTSTLGKVYTENVWQRQRLDQIRQTVMADIRGEIYEQMQSKQLGYLETLSRLSEDRQSFARFGDGEFRLIVRPDFNIRFQKNSPELREALREVLTTPSESLLVGMPEVFTDVHWSTVYSEVWHVISGLLPRTQTFGNSHVTRPTAFEQFGQDAVHAWRAIWEGRKVTIVTGRGSRFNRTPALFSGARSIDEVFSTATNAFSDLDRVVDELGSRNADVVLISLGAAGTVLAHRLAGLGMQGLDIGHLSASYEHVVDGEEFPEKLPLVVPR